MAEPDSVRADMQRAEGAMREALSQPTPGDRLEAVWRLLSDWPEAERDTLNLVVAGRLMFLKG